MILFLFLILIILVTICIYTNNFSNQEGNTIYVKKCGDRQYIKNGVCTDMEGSTATDLSGQCLKHLISDSTSDYFNFSKILDYIGKKSEIKLNPGTYDSCNLNDYEHKDSFTQGSTQIFNINTSLLPQTAVTCVTTTKKVKGNLYCKYNTAVNDTVITGDISCVDVSDFKDVEWYRNVANYSFEYTNDGSRDKLHYVCKNGTTINGDNSGSILASDWEGANFINDSVKCKCPDDVDGQIQFYYDGICNSKPEHSTIGEGGKNINNADVATHGPGDCKGRWSQVESCKKLDNKVTFKAEFFPEYGNVDGNGLPNGNYYSTSCEGGNGENYTSFNSVKGVKVVGDKYEKDFDCDQSCGKWSSVVVQGCGGSSDQPGYGFIYSYIDGISDISKNQCYFEAPNYPGVKSCLTDPFFPPFKEEEEAESAAAVEQRAA